MRSEEKGTSESLTRQVEGVKRQVEAIKGQVPAPREQPQGMTERFVGTLDIVDSEGRMAFQFDADNRRILAWDGEDREVLRFDGSNARLQVGGTGNDGDLSVSDAEGKRFMAVDSGSHQLRLHDDDGREFIRFEAADHRFFGYDDQGRRVLTFYGNPAQLYVGGEGNEGDFYVTDGGGKNFIHADSGSHRLRINDADGQEFLRFESGEHQFFGYDEQGRRVLIFYGQRAQLYVGGDGNEGDLYIVHPSGVNTIQLDGNSGDIILRNADAAEEFDAVDGKPVEAGTVVVLGDDGAVQPSREPYDPRVAGIVSGAGEYRPGVLMDRRDRPARVPIAMMGKVFCRVDATGQPVSVGDLLTTSTMVGHAMRATDAARAMGAVIGKALRPLADGIGLVPVLVSLQ